MTDNPARVIDLPVDAFADLAEGYFHLITNFDHGWSLGLIFADGARRADEDLAIRNEQAGVPILWLNDDELYALVIGPATLPCRGERYLITVENVEDLDELLAERQANSED